MSGGAADAAPRRAGHALQHPAFRTYFIGQLLSMSGTWMHQAAQAWLVWDMSHDEALVGALAAAGYGAMLVFSFVGGAAADRFDRRKLMLVTQSTALVLAAALGIACLVAPPRIAFVAAVAVGLGVVNAFDLPTRHALVADLVPKDTLVNAVALNQLLFNAARVVGPAFAGLLIARTRVGAGGVFLVNAASYVAILVALARIHPLARPVARAPKSPLLDGLHFALRTPPVRGVLALVAAVGVFGWSVPVILPSLATNVLRGDASLYGTLVTAIGAGAIVGSLVLARIAPRARPLVVIPCGLFVWCGALAMLSAAASVPLAVGVLVLAGCGMILFSATSNALVQTTVPDALRGRVMGVWSLVFAVSEPIGSLQAGASARAFGPAEAIRIAATAMGAFGLAWLASRLWVSRSA